MESDVEVAVQESLNLGGFVSRQVVQGEVDLLPLPVAFRPSYRRDCSTSATLASSSSGLTGLLSTASAPSS
jgi:hypothetical protein